LYDRNRSIIICGILFYLLINDIMVVSDRTE
jgi:hypothetical protein